MGGSMQYVALGSLSMSDWEAVHRYLRQRLGAFP